MLKLNDKLKKKITPKQNSKMSSAPGFFYIKF